MMESSPSTLSATAGAIIRTARLTKVDAGADFRALDELSLAVAIVGTHICVNPLRYVEASLH